MARKLRNLVIDRIDLVDKGANQEAAIVLAKSFVNKDSPSVGAVHADRPISGERDEVDKEKDGSDSGHLGAEHGDKGAKHGDKGADDGKLGARYGHLGAKHGSRKEKNVSPSLFKRMLALFKEADPAKRDQELALISKEVCDDPEMVDKDKDGDKDKDKDKDNDKDKPAFLAEKRDNDAVNKQLTDMQKQLVDAQARVEKAEKAAADATAIAKAERDTRADREMVDVLKSFKATPFNLDMAKPDNDLRKFRKMQEADPDGFARTMEIMKAADAQLVVAKSFDNLGTSRGGNGGDAWAQIEAKADEMVTKSTTTLTREQAIERVMTANPALVKQYRQQQQ